MSEKLYPPTHPGDVVTEDSIDDLDMTESRRAVSIVVPPRRISETAIGTRTITADTTVRRGRCCSATSRFWPDPQTRSEFELAQDHVSDPIMMATMTRLARYFEATDFEATGESWMTPRSSDDLRFEHHAIRAEVATLSLRTVA